LYRPLCSTLCFAAMILCVSLIACVVCLSFHFRNPLTMSALFLISMAPHFLKLAHLTIESALNLFLHFGKNYCLSQMR